MTLVDDLLWQRWDEVDRLLDEVLDLPTDQRTRHLAQRAGEDPALHGLVLRLLDRLDGETDRITGPSEAVVIGAFVRDGDPLPPSDVEPGTRIGHYVITGRRGRGGMATVYEAERSDGAYDQRVALKVLRRGLDTDDMIRRFRTERQILSSLSHPNIARLLDGGSLPDGRPYLVMDLVEGQPITAFADATRLDVRGRMDLFLEVAGAVHAAHRRLVVHRDIKPSNILVDAEGRVKLLDFGIAKLLEADEGDTQAGVRVLTPDYASPEQIRGDPITTGTDVYQLGLLLRELLTGLPPLAGDTQPGEPPIRPSRASRLEVAGAAEPAARAEARRTTPPRLAKTLGGDLDIIVGKALRPDPEERYTSADGLAADVRRYLQGRPIQARPASTRYRFRKFAARHPLFLPGAVGAVVAMVGFITVLSIQNRRVGRERDAAEAASRRALATQAFLVDLLRSPDPTGSADQAPNRDITVVEALQRGRGRVATELGDQPEVKAALLEAMGRTFTGLGRFETADTLLRQSLRIHHDLFGTADPRAGGVVGAIGDNYRKGRDFAAADSFLHEELRLRNSAGPVADTAIARMLGVLSMTRRDLGDIDSAVALAAGAVTVLRAASDTTGELFTSTLGALAYVLRGAKHLDSAEVVYREVLRRQERLSPPNPYDLSLTYNNLGYLLRTRGDLPAAESSYREALRLAGEGVGDGHPHTLQVGSNLAAVLELEGKLEEVIVIGRERIAAAERQWPQGHWRVGSAYMALGRFLLRHDRAAEALAPLEAGVERYAEILGARHSWTAVARAELGTALLLLGQTARGGALLDQAYAVLRSQGAGIDDDSRLNLARVVAILQRYGNSERAEQFKPILPPQ